MNKIIATIKRIKKQVSGFVLPSVNQVSRNYDPFLVLISCILSLRTKDKTTISASNRLFKIADNPEKLAGLPLGKIRRLIYPVGFYRTKAKAIKQISKRIIEEYFSRVPDKLEELLKLKGVGRKTANLVLGLGYGIPAICVDTHVHRITNRLGWVRTKNPEDTEAALEKIVPKKLWIELNTLLVAFGQNICVPVSPFCSRCDVFDLCQRRGIKKSR